MRFLRILVIVPILFLSGRAWADEVLPPEPSPMDMQADTTLPATPPEDYGPAFFKMIAALVGLLVIIFIVMWLIKGISRGRFSRRSDTPHIAIIERHPLSPKSMLYLIEVDGARVLLAESQLEVRSLHQSLVITDEETNSKRL